jgi:DNA segregation ATPase FtsK/SpoIIIE-like protein
MEADDQGVIRPPEPRRKLHNVIAIGEMSPPLAKQFGRFEVLNAYAESRLTRLGTTLSGQPFSLALQDDAENYAWLFTNHRNIGSPVLADMLVKARETSATFLHVYCESDADARALAAWAPPVTAGANFNLMLAPYRADDFHALDLFLACTKERPAPALRAVRTSADIRAKDPLYPPARRLVLDHGILSLSLIQRSLHIGYSRAAQLLQAVKADLEGGFRPS